MLSVHNFDEIRPYRNDEFVSVMSRLLDDPQFNSMLRNLNKGEVELENMKAGLRATTSIEVFQDQFIVPVINQILSLSSEGLSMTGLEELDKNQRYLFISNHRDIILDSALLNVEMHASGFSPTEIAIGSNLLIFPWINDLVRINRSFIVKRNIPVKQMLNMSNSDGFFEGFRELKIVPMSISYEIEPCGNEKVAELKKRQIDPNFQKTERDDLLSMVSGLKNQKGRIHIQFGRQITDNALLRIAEEPSMNERMRLLAEQVDAEIYKNYKLFPNNFIAYDLYFNSSKFTSEYTEADKEAFLELTHKRLQLVNEDIEDSMLLWLKMYATPVCNYEKFVLREVGMSDL